MKIYKCCKSLAGGVVLLPLTSHTEDWVFKPSLRQAVQATKLWLVEALIRASKVKRVHSGLGLRLPMLQRYSCLLHRKDCGRNAQEKEIGTSTTSFLGSATYFFKLSSPEALLPSCPPYLFFSTPLLFFSLAFLFFT